VDHLLAGSVFQGFGHLSDDVERSADWQWSPFADPLQQIDAVNIFQCQIQIAVYLPGLIHANDMRVLEVSPCLTLRFEAFDEQRIFSPFLLQNFEGHCPPQIAIMGEIGPEATLNLIFAQLLRV
jgi:hypothetical protein